MFSTILEWGIRWGQSVLDVTVSVAPWLLLGLVVAAAVRLLIPDTRLQQWLGGSGLAPVARAAVVGAPLPLCSCGTIPTALSLHRGGASRGASTAFLVGTPGIGIDSVVLTWVLMGPFLTVARVAGAVVTALATGLAVGRFAESPASPAAASSSAAGQACCSASACSSGMDGDTEEGAGEATAPARLAGIATRLSRQILELTDDIGTWLLVGLALAGTLTAFVSPGAVAAWGGGLSTMIALALVGIPLYICATAATPLAAAMLIAGVSPGAVLVFLIAGPVTSLATLMVLRREMGSRAVAVYLTSVLACALAVGILVDGAAALSGYDPAALTGAARAVWPDWVDRAAAGVMLVLIVVPARRAVRRSARWAWYVAWGGRRVWL